MNIPKGMSYQSMILLFMSLAMAEGANKQQAFIVAKRWLKLTTGVSI